MANRQQKIVFFEQPIEPKRCFMVYKLKNAVANCLINMEQ